MSAPDVDPKLQTERERAARYVWEPGDVEIDLDPPPRRQFGEQVVDSPTPDPEAR